MSPTPQKTLTKADARNILARKLSLPKTTRAICIDAIEDAELRDFMERACEAIGVVLIRHPDPHDLYGYDAILTDQDSLWRDGVNYITKGIVPIMPEKNVYDGKFSEFNPMKFSGNAFLYEQKNVYMIFEKICRYLENTRYPGDRRTLQKNVESTKL